MLKKLYFQAWCSCDGFGESFSKSEKELIFKKFYKVQNHKNSDSLGFGLWACK